MSESIAWISRGRLFVKHGEAEILEIESDFAKNSLERELRRSGNNAWKGRSGVWNEMGMSPPGDAPWENGDPLRRIRFVTATSGDSPEQIYYVLDLGAVGGLFCYDMELDEETRLMHSQSFQAKDLSRHPVDRQIAVAVIREDGTMGLSINRHDGLYGKAVSLSDTIDEAPSWLPDGTRRLVFQSTAIGRDDEGHAIGTSTSRIELLDIDDESISKLVEDETCDLLQPRMLNDESLLFIRRPYKSSHVQPATMMETIQDVLYFPFRLMRAFVYFFHFMSMAFTGKPLMTAGGDTRRKREQDPFLVLYGQAVDTRKALASGAGKDKDRPLVPQEWQLVHRTKAGDESVLASNVVSFDADADGRIVFTNGTTIFQLAIGQAPSKLTSGDLVEKVILLK